MDLVPTLKFMQCSLLALLLTIKSLIAKNPVVLNRCTHCEMQSYMDWFFIILEVIIFISLSNILNF